LGIALAIIYQHQGRSATAGLILAVVTSIKYYPGVIIFYFVIQRDVRFIVGFAVGILACNGLLPILWLGIAGWLHFTAASLSDFPTYRMFLGSPGSQHFVHVLLRWAYNVGSPISEATYHALRGSGVVFFALHIVLAEWFRRKGGERTTALSAATLLLALPFVVPSSWAHYFVYLPLCQMTLALIVADRVVGLWIRRLLWLPLAISIISSSIYFFSAFPAFRLYYNLGMLFFADILSLATLYGVAVSMRLQRK
jgi:hypothetical protein